MPRSRDIVVYPPVGGVARNFDFQSQPPFTCVSALNFWGRDVKTGRQRLALRPRLASYGTGITNTVRGLAQVNVATNQTLDRGLFAIVDTGVDGYLYRYHAGAWSNVGVAADSGRAIAMAPYLQNLYIAGNTTSAPAGRPRVYDCDANTLAAMTASAGDIADIDNCTIVSVGFDRLIWSGKSATPHGFWMSRVGEPTDYEFNLDATDVTQAVNSTTLDGGNIGEKITCIHSHNRECVLFGGTDSLHICRSDPMQGGRMEVLSHTVGPLGQFALCKTGDDQTVFLTRNGLYYMPAGCGAAAQQLSKQRIPDSLMGIDSSQYDAFVEYDTRFDGVHIFVTERSGATLTNKQAWWLDWETGGYWPLAFTNSEQARCLMRFDPLDEADKSGVLIGSSAVRRYDRTDVSSISLGGVYIGPLRLSPTPHHKSIIQRMKVIFGDNHDDTTGTIAIYCAESGEAAYNAAVADDVHHKYTITCGQLQTNNMCFPRVGGHAAVIKVSLGGPTKHSSIEQIVLTTMEAGQWR